MQANNGLMFPDFQHNIVNISATLAQYLGKPTDKAILPRLQKALQQDHKNLIYLVVDGMGLKILAKHLPATDFLRRHVVQTLTSVFPSTTTSATTTILSAQYPAEHGWFAWAVNLDGHVVELFRDRDYYTKVPLVPDFAYQRLPYTYFFADIPTAITTHICMPATTKIPPTTHYHQFRRPRQLFRVLRKICQMPGRQFAYAYRFDLDDVMHDHGTTCGQARRLLRKLSRDLQKLVQKYPDTLVVVTADHGQIDTQGHVPLYQDQALQACLAQPVSLDPRGAAFHVKPDQHAQFARAFAQYQADFALYPTQTLIDQGVFGTTPDPEKRAMLGDYLAIGKATGKSLVFKADKKLHRGEHTGLTPDEMLVPLIIINGKAGC